MCVLRCAKAAIYESGRDESREREERKRRHRVVDSGIVSETCRCRLFSEPSTDIRWSSELTQCAAEN
jgi:hypothetical protein